MARFRRRLRRLERCLKPPPDPTFAYISYDTEEERDQKIAALPPSVKQIVCIPNMAPSIEEWQAEVRADEARRRRERDSEHPTYD
ncbi:MAG TPA: hypothetical protein VHJ19_13050 [Gammaproteobacteria bacterium]|nr:hypothetical protein [Gammaproteobacteria bacterium]